MGMCGAGARTRAAGLSQTSAPMDELAARLRAPLRRRGSVRTAGSRAPRSRQISEGLDHSERLRSRRGGGAHVRCSVWGRGAMDSRGGDGQSFRGRERSGQEARQRVDKGRWKRARPDASPLDAHAQLGG